MRRGRHRRGGRATALSRAPEEAGRRIEIAAGGDRDAGGLGWQPAGGAVGLPVRRPDEQPGIVPADGSGADQDGVRCRPFRVHPVQIGRAGQHQPLLARPVEVSVQRHRAAEHDVGTSGHG